MLGNEIQVEAWVVQESGPDDVSIKSVDLEARDGDGAETEVEIVAVVESCSDEELIAQPVFVVNIPTEEHNRRFRRRVVVPPHQRVVVTHHEPIEREVPVVDARVVYQQEIGV